jgi:type II secretory pathway pseudopilin PulG
MTVDTSKLRISMIPASPIRRALHSSPGAPGPSHLGTGEPTLTRKPTPDSEQGYVMLIAIFLIALLVIALAVAAPKMARSIQRDRDLETFHRGMQYRRAIQLYYRKFHAYPPNVEALVNTNDIRFLRKKYIDPMTGQDDWKPIAFGQNKTPTAMGFFGQPLAGNASTLAGIGPSGGGLQGTQTSGGSSNGGFSSGGFSSGLSDTSNDQSSPTSGSGTTGSPPDSPGNTTGGAGTTGGTSSATSSTSSTSGSSGPIIGGAGIIGFEPASPKQSILVYKKKNHYNEWEFTYDPLSDLKMIGGGSTGLNGQPGTSTTTPASTTPFGTTPSTGPPETPAPPQ